MKKSLAILCIGLSLTGCLKKSGDSGTDPLIDPNAQQKPAKVEPGTVAIVNGQPITMDQLQKPLVEGYGLNVLFNLVQLEMAKQAAARKFIVVSEDDFNREMEQTLNTMFKDNNEKALSEADTAEVQGKKDVADRIRKEVGEENQQLLDQFLEGKRLSRAEFEIVIRTNAYLRKIVEPSLKDAITDKMIEDGFRFQYGEKAQVRHIQCANWQEIAEVKAHLAKGEDFAEVARQFSRNARTAPLGGELRPFSRAEPSLDDNFKAAAFALREPGEVSGVTMSGNAMHLIQLVKLIGPTAVKLEDVKDSIRKQLYQGLMTEGMKQLRMEFGQQAMKSLKIIDPTLKAQFDKRTREAKSAVQGKEDTLKKLAEERMAAARAIATQPTTAPAPATQPASVPATSPAQ